MGGKRWVDGEVHLGIPFQLVTCVLCDGIFVTVNSV